MIASALTNLVLLQMVTASIAIVQDIAGNILLLRMLRRHTIWCDGEMRDGEMRGRHE